MALRWSLLILAANFSADGHLKTQSRLDRLLLKGLDDDSTRFWPDIVSSA